ncbi:hypothetical protein ACWD6Q_35500 [Streptomyces nigra]|uniref:hypothetical protein n=1 Tax=Streptomyces nigra TaxID=1827580 RepID=UPI0036A08165
MGESVGAIDITAPDGFEVRRAYGWKISKTAEVAAFLWDVMEQDRSRAAERAHLPGPGPENSKGRYMPLTPQMAAQTQQALQAASDWGLEHDADIALWPTNRERMRPPGSSGRCYSGPPSCRRGATLLRVSQEA